eukprot:8164176-Pyramimonas_sp.AAC.1
MRVVCTCETPRHVRLSPRQQPSGSTKKHAQSRQISILPLRTGRCWRSLETLRSSASDPEGPLGQA